MYVIIFILQVPFYRFAFPSSKIFFANICANAFSIVVIWLFCFFWPFLFSFLHSKFFFLVSVRAMPRVAAALTTGLVVSCFFQLIGFVIYMISCSSAHIAIYTL
jgi:hypothetical protein